MSSIIDLTGQRFGRLLVIKRVDNLITKSNKSYVYWLCKCDCGNEIKVTATNLKNNKTKSCGCYQREMASKRRIKYNTYDLKTIITKEKLMGKYGKKNEVKINPLAYNICLIGVTCSAYSVNCM